MDLQKFVLNYKNDVVKSIQESVRIKSVQEDPKEGMPFGEGPAKALEHMLNLGKNLGFKVENFDNYAGHIDFGDGPDEEMIGILGHVDVVPEGKGWDYPPYEAKIVDGKLYGRGVLDDKGPTIAALYALKAIKDSGVKLNRKVRVIVGANEETGWGCMNHYFGELKMPQPAMAFTPDSTFPVTYAEKGILHLSLTKEYNDKLDFIIKGGVAFNSVPDSAIGIFPLSLKNEIDLNLEKYNEEKEFKITSVEKEGKIELLSLGKASHGARPSNGYNAITALFEFLSTLKIEDKKLKNLVEFFNEYVGMEYSGKKLGINFKDEPSGELTLTVGKIECEDNKIMFGFDIRYPVTYKKDQVINEVEKRAKTKGMDITIRSAKNPLYVPKDSFLVTTLMDIYKDITGDIDAEPVSIGGGTYARAVNNGVAFGALLKDQEDNMHQKNEYLELDKLDTWLKIYVQAIYNLAK
ncbi:MULTISPECIES: dipeptidase PepV [Cetobacterium]|uniref:Dipeptidase PepV n=1 Tax=Candidatus Cetobacterium colombiensis TaxID=3073100 RepID=A0ABU4W780_9FUSO|nr:dipeptidase PepV [Candidatus Cetobacterium colombiensis]MDX8335382.1 dipeptidase PepV [Candidatus Cetobacterium colombiensis]